MPVHSESEMNDFDFTGKTVLVVGGSSGIGNAIAQSFRARGADVHVWGTRPQASDYKAEEGCDLAGLHYTQVDVGNFSSIAALKPAFDRLDVLVLSQGIVLYGRREFEIDGFQRVIDVNLNSLMACSSRFQEMLKQSRGSLIILSSMAGFRSTKGNPAYNASKAGAIGLTRTLGEAWAEDGIRVNGIAPGLVDTKLTKVTTDNPKRREGMEQRVPLKRLGQPEDIAGTALFLASPLSAYIVGQTIVVDGGLTLA
jgi:3-oxoacyl-[acyl-carrier protein] reductase